MEINKIDILKARRPEKKKFTLYLTTDDVKKLRKVCGKAPVSRVIDNLIRAYLEQAA